MIGRLTYAVLDCRAIVKYMMSGRQAIECPLCTVSDLVAKFDLEQIHFLKIDVERAELSVLQGININDWAKVQNIVVEVHDIDGRLEVVLNLLRQQGFDSVIAKEAKLLEKSGLWNVYAHR